MDLADVVAALVIGAPLAAVEAIADAIENVAAPGPAADALVSAAVPQPHTRSQALELSKSWQAAAPHISGAALALALRSAARSVRTVRSTQTVELVWSGPSTDVVMRPTIEALRDVCRQATRTLVLSSFSASPHADLLNELRTAADRGVDITIILETTSANAQNLGGAGAAGAFAEILDQIHLYAWPDEQRPDKYAAMHFKAAVADRHAAFVSSANLSAAAFERSMELGILVVGEPLPGRLESHLRGLIAGGHLKKVSP